MHKFQLLPALVVLIFGLAACGGGGGDQTSDAEQARVAETIERFATNGEPAACKTIATQRFLEQTQFNVGHEALERCEEDAERTVDDPDSMEISEVEVDGASATADVAFEGGNLDGQTLAVGLVKEKGEWRMDTVTGFAEFDKDKLATASEAALESQGLSSESGLAACFGDAIRSLSDEKAEELMLSGSQREILSIVGKCAGGGSQ